MPTKRKSSPGKRKPRPEVTFDDAAQRLEDVLRGPTRREILDAAAARTDPRGALRRLGDAMSVHRFEASAGTISLQRIVNRLDARTREDGFHVLNDWDGVADRFNDVIIPVEVVRFMEQAYVEKGSARQVLAILLDYYFCYLLALLNLRIWDSEDPDAALDRVTDLLGDLQGPKGSGQKLAESAEILFFVATSHFEPDERAYVRLLARVRTLNAAHRTRAALAIGAILGSHLRFGFEATYNRDLVALRNDNTPDYPWVLFAGETLMEAYARLSDEGMEGEERERVVEGLLNALSPDPRALVGNPPPSLAEHRNHHARFQDLFRRRREELLSELERQEPARHAYSPIAFYFNFSHNVLKGVVVDALLRGRPWAVTLGDLLTGIPREAARNQSRRELAETLMRYARTSPDRIGGRLIPVIVYDPRKAQRAFSETLRHARESGEGTAPVSDAH